MTSKSGYRAAINAAKEQFKLEKLINPTPKGHDRVMTGSCQGHELELEEELEEEIEKDIYTSCISENEQKTVNQGGDFQISEAAYRCLAFYNDVLRDIRNIESSLSGESKIGFVERFNNLGFKVKDSVYYLNKRDTFLLMSGYSVELRARIIDRWQTTFSTALNESGRYSPDWIEIQLAHVPKGIRAIYNQAAYLKQRRAMFPPFLCLNPIKFTSRKSVSRYPENR